MSDELSPFHAELLEYIQKDVERREVEEGFDPSYDRSFRDFQSDLTQALEPGSADVPLPLPQIIDQYNYLIGSRGAIHLELKLLESFPEKEFAELGLSHYYPRIYRGLPRLYYKENASLSRVKSHFAHLPSLKRIAVEKALFSLYGSYKPKSGKVVLFTWVISDGFGDWVAAQEICQILRHALPQVEIDLVAFMPERFRAQVAEGKIIFYDEDCPVSLIPEEYFNILKSANLILQTPTHYPYTKELTERLQKESFNQKFENLGEYGYVESSWFHPKTGQRSMGLHFLEKGILTRKIPANGFAALENSQLLQWLFGTEGPGPAEIERYEREYHFYLAYLCTPFAGKIYLHALLKSLERDERPIDLCSPSLGWFIEHLEECKRNSQPILQESFGVARIEVWQGDRVYAEKIADIGKVVRLLCPGSLNQTDFQALLTASGEFVAVRGDQSFSEVVCANKAFFYDSRTHARYFVKDLAAVAESRIASHRGTLTCIRQMTRAFLAHLPQQENDWVDEVHFQQAEPFDWYDASQKIGIALQDPDTLAGFKKFNRMIADEFSCNEYIVNLVKRSLLHAQDPVVAYLEEKQLALFTSQRQPFKALIQNLRDDFRAL